MFKINIVEYVHHGVKVKVNEFLKGHHRNYCLCHSGCKKFKPGEIDHCEIAKRTFEHDRRYHITTPVFECEEFQNKEVK